MSIRRLVPRCSLALGAAYCTVGVGTRLTGTWGGDGAGIEVAADRAILSYTCGQTTISGPIIFDDDRRFEVTGQHVRVGGPPPRPDAAPERQRSHVAGRVRGDYLAFTVRLIDMDQTLGPFVVKRGAAASILGCP